MVLTRRQEQILSTPPPAARQQQPGDQQQQQQLGEASPVTPVAAATTLPNGRPLPLKSALKQTRLGPGGGRAGDASDEGTPGGAAVKKHVRIHSSSNMVHIFQSSLNTDEWPSGAASPAGASSDSEGDTPESSPRRRGGSRSSSGRQRSTGRPDLPRYSQFMAGVFGDMRSSRSSGGGANSASNGHSAAAADRGGSSRGSGGRPRGGAVLGLLFTLSWMLASSALIFVNKLIMVDHGFRFPFALTSLGQLSSMLLAWVASRLGMAPLRRPPPLATVLTRLLPVSASFAASLFLGNVAYLGLSVAFINIMKAATPMVTLAVGLAMGLERTCPTSLLATVLIAVGTAIATASEAASGHFQWLSFAAFSASILFEGIRVVLTEKLLGQARYNVMEALVYLGPLTFAILAGGAYCFEWDQGLSTVGLRVVQQRPLDFVVAAVISFLVNLFCYLSIRHVSATSFKVAGCLKNVMVVWGGILQGDVVTVQELQGYAISLGGFILFSAVKLRGSGGKGRSADSQAAAAVHRKQR